jgi:hypothetical protein
MKRYSYCSFLLAFFFLAVLVDYFIPEGHAAGQMREVVLQDDSVIIAEVISFEKGFYTLRSETMGELRLQDSAIRSIHIPGKAGEEKFGSISEKSAQTSSKEDITGVQGSLLSSPGLLGLVFALQNDPEVQSILQDQEIMALMASGEVKKLESNPKFIKLMKNPKIRAILDQMPQ